MEPIINTTETAVSVSEEMARYYYPISTLSTDNTSVTIHVAVTPDDRTHLASWAILWGLFVAAVLFCSYQIRLENRWFAARKTDIEQAGGVGGIGGSGGIGIGTGDGEVVSSADLTRKRFRRLLLVAMVFRTAMIPVQVLYNSTPLWAELVADTFPAMAFASAWTLLVTFFVRLVGVALGSGGAGTGPTPGKRGVVVQIAAYCVYAWLVGTACFVNAAEAAEAAAVLLYAFLSCIYAALLGTALCSCPRLLSLLSASLARNSALAVRLAGCSATCLFVFAARAFGYARRVVSPSHTAASWWWQYGALELAPCVLFLVSMHPTTTTTQARNSSHNNSSSNSSNSRGRGEGGGGGPGGTPPLVSTSGKPMHRSESYPNSPLGRNTALRINVGSAAAAAAAAAGVETAPLLRPISSYGSNVGRIHLQPSHDGHD